MAPHHVLVRFGSSIPPDAQGRAMLAFEKCLREQGVPAEVFKDYMGDDLKRRSEMTIDQREKL